MLAGVGRALGGRDLPGTVDGDPLEAADIDGVIDHIAAAAGLAGMFADKGAGGGEGVVLSYKADGVLISSGGHKGYVARDIDPGGTHGDTGHGL